MKHKQTNILIEEYPCPACKSLSCRVFMEGCKDILYRCPGEWLLLECMDCQLIFRVPSLTQDNLLKYYPKEYSPYNPEAGLNGSILGGLLRNAAMFPYRLRFGSPEWTESPFGNGHLLDVGCGAGALLKQMTALGWKCWGLDVSSIAIEKAQKNVPQATYLQSTLTDLNIKHTFDAIVLSHVLEHLPDPVDSLHKCFDLLVPGGKLLIGIPNINSPEANLFGRYWSGLDIPRHMVHFRKSVIRRLLEASGFSVEKVRPTMFASSISESLIMMLPEEVRYRFLHSRVARYLYLLMVFPAALSYLLGNRGIIEIVARKSDEFSPNI